MSGAGDEDEDRGAIFPDDFAPRELIPTRRMPRVTSHRIRVDLGEPDALRHFFQAAADLIAERTANGEAAIYITIE